MQLGKGFRAWRVSDEISVPDHNQITFELSDVKAEVQVGRNHRKTV